MMEFAYPPEAQEEIENVYIRAFKEEQSLQELRQFLKAYEKDSAINVLEFVNFFNRVAEKAKTNVYSLYMSIFLLMADVAKEHYRKANLPDGMWKDNFIDLRYKLEECKLVKGVWGTFVPAWYIRFFNVSRFAFGKLQFEIELFQREYEKNGVVLTKESQVVNMHIPRTGTGLSPQDVDEACAAAARFFKERYQLEQVVFVCHSWLLYPENKKMLQPTSNLYSFLSRFDIVQVEEYNDYKEVWRLFDKEYTGDLSLLPADTSLRRAYIEKMRKGEKTGAAYGVFVYKQK
jgi:hypothetical protein